MRITMEFTDTSSGLTGMQVETFENGMSDDPEQSNAYLLVSILKQHLDELLDEAGATKHPVSIQ